MSVAIVAAPPVPVARMSNAGAPGSLLAILINADSEPAVVGVYITVKSTSAFGLMISGVDGPGSTLKPADPNSRWTVLMTRLSFPTLKTWMVSLAAVPWQTLPN